MLLSLLNGVSSPFKAILPFPLVLKLPLKPIFVLENTEGPFSTHILLFKKRLDGLYWCMLLISKAPQ